MTAIPDECPGCGADLTAEDAVAENDYIPVAYGGRIVGGEYVNNGHGFEWFDQDGDMAVLECAACERTLRAATRIPVAVDALRGIERKMQSSLRASMRSIIGTARP